MSVVGCADDPGHRPGHHRHDVPGLRRRGPPASGARTPSSASTSRARAGSSTTRSEIWERHAARRRARRSTTPAIGGADLAGIGITNQRETAVAWDRAIGRAAAPRDRLAGPAHRRRAATSCARRATSRCSASAPGSCSTPTSPARSTSGCCATEARRARARRRASARSTRGCVFKLTGARTSPTTRTPSRTLLFDIRERRWDEELCELLGVPVALAARAASATRVVYGETSRVRRPRAGLRDGRRPAGGALRPGAATRPGSARTPTAPATSCCRTPARGSPLLEHGPAHDDRVGDRRPRRLRARGEHLRHRRGGAVAARRARASSRRAAETEALARVARRQRRRLLRAGADRARLAALGPVRARDDRRADARRRARAPRARDARGDRLPDADAVRAPGHRARASRSTSCASTAARPRTAG